MLLSNAPLTLGRDNLDTVFHTNVSSAHMVTSAFLPLLKNGNQKKVINMCVFICLARLGLLWF